MVRDNAAARVQAENAGCTPAGLCRQALEALDHVLGRPPAARLHEIDAAERLVVHLRDCLIERRRGAAADVSSTLSSALAQVNAAVSLLVGVEYPAAGAQEKLLEQARRVLQDLLTEDRLAV